MNARILVTACISTCLLLSVGQGASAQRGPGGGGPPPPPGGMGPGGPGGPGGPNGPGGQGNHGGPPPPNSGQGSGDSSGQGHAGNAGHEGFQFGPVGRWWDDKSVVQQIGLSKEQQKKMDAIFNQNKPAILSTYKAFLKQKSSLEALNKNPSADKATVFAAIDAASQARTALEKATTQMLLEIKQQMSPDQIEKLEKLK